MFCVRTTFLSAAAALLLSAGPAFAADYKVDPASSDVGFTAVGKPGFLRINGKDAKLEGKAAVTPTGASGEFSTKIDQFVTGIDMRDEHMKKKYLESEKFPKATLKWTMPKSGLDGGEVPFKGQLTLHGITKDVEGTAKLDPSSDKKKVGVEATFPLKLSDFKIDLPSYLGITVAEDVEVHTKFDLVGG